MAVTPSPPKKTPSRRLWMFRIAAVCLPLVGIGLLELGLRVAGVGYSTSFLVPSPDRPGILVDNYRFAWRFFPKSLARSPQPIAVSASKPSGATRILVFGGSAAMGDPEPAYGLARVLQVLLEQRFPNRDFEVINAAVTAINSHVVLPIAKDCVQLDADAWVVYLGNNEVHGPLGAGTVFGSHDQPLWLSRAGLALRKTRLGQAAFGVQASARSGAPQQWGGLEMFLEQKIPYNDPQLDRVYDKFRSNLQDITKVADRAGTLLLVSTVATNLRDSAPFVSLHRPDLTVAELAEWQAAFDAGCQAQLQGSWEAGRDALRQAIEIDGDHAECVFRYAQCLMRLADSQHAAQQFSRARDLDALRFRADAAINDTIRSLAGSVKKDRNSVVFVDAARELASDVPDGILGDETFFEHVHLRFSGNYRLAKLFAEQLVRTLRLPQGSDSAWVSEGECAQQLGLSTFHRLQIRKEMVGRLNSAPFTNQWNHAERDRLLRQSVGTLSQSLTATAARETQVAYQLLIEKRPDDDVLRKQYAVLLDSLGDLPTAIGQFQVIVKKLSHHAESFFRLGALYNRTKQWPEAETALRRALALRPDFVRAANSLGICLSHQQRFDECYSMFQAAVSLQPTFAEALVNWGLVLANQGDNAAAMQKYKAAVAADEAYVPGHRHLGKAYLNVEDYTAAKPHYAKVAELRPNDAAAHLNFGLLLLRIDGERQEATTVLQRVLEIDPTNQFASRALAQLGLVEEE